MILSCGALGASQWSTVGSLVSHDISEVLQFNSDVGAAKISYAPSVLFCQDLAVIRFLHDWNA